MAFSRKSFAFTPVSVLWTMTFAAPLSASGVTAADAEFQECPAGYERVDTWTGEVERLGQAESFDSVDAGYEHARALAEEDLVTSLVAVFNMCDGLPGNQDFRFNPEKRVQPESPVSACRLNGRLAWDCAVRVGTSVICCAER
jgi:hypothetical protein